MLVSLRQAEREWRLATVDAGPPPRYAVDARLTMPEEARPGPAVVAIHTRLAAEPFEVPVNVVGSEGLPDTGGPDFSVLAIAGAVLATVVLVGSVRRANRR